ncbi:endoribonuclease MazF [Oceanispirochaeta sp.]|uniref:endoribonuclease MazF n=1 Tax=Oceanispirochaeta sp. TaxID=2035350 RepID=UPI002620C133|nr:endoribonuclease MazF [Oceanispirochaeta sp.]MDA3958356.1 endoribonuclease MazF [Oceanispirochaeta sp.]
MVDPKYIPRKGDLLWLNFTPQTGHEQAGKRPVIVLSPLEYNKKTSLMIVCPITSKVKGYPFEVPVRAHQIEGVVLSDQIKSLDWRTRKVSFIEKASTEILEDVQEKLLLLIG